MFVLWGGSLMHKGASFETCAFVLDVAGVGPEPTTSGL